jgi:hypothetical protein
VGGKSFKKGEDVEWKSHGQNVKGTVAEKITEDRSPYGAGVEGRPAISSQEQQDRRRRCAQTSRASARLVVEVTR